jgi:hypothetical protein
MFAQARATIGRDDLTWHDQRHDAADGSQRGIAERLDQVLGERPRTA